MINMTLQDAIAMEKDFFDYLMQNSTDTISFQPPTGLDDLNKRKITIREVPSSMMPFQPHPNGTLSNAKIDAVTKQAGDYFIFIIDSPAKSPNIPSLAGDCLSQYIVLHEYAHAKYGDVFEDDPPKIYDRKMNPVFDNNQVELNADGYAAHKIMEIALAKGNNILSQELQQDINNRGLPKP